MRGEGERESGYMARVVRVGCGRDCDCLEVLKIVLLLISIPTIVGSA